MDEAATITRIPRGAQGPDTDPLFQPYRLGPFNLRHRIVMAPLTRSRAQQPGNVPSSLAACYHAQRASAALIVSEATQVSMQGQGYAWTPGIHSREQIDGWHRVSEAVHEEGGRMFMQLWHVGRISHPALQPDQMLPVAPSAIRPSGENQTWRATVLPAFVDPGLEDLLIEHGAPADIDYLSVDTEGSELDILSAFDFDRYKVRIITVEHNYRDDVRASIHQLLTTNGFKREFETFTDYDDWYYHPQRL